MADRVKEEEEEEEEGGSECMIVVARGWGECVILACICLCRLTSVVALLICCLCYHCLSFPLSPPFLLFSPRARLCLRKLCLITRLGSMCSAGAPGRITYTWSGTWSPVGREK